MRPIVIVLVIGVAAALAALAVWTRSRAAASATGAKTVVWVQPLKGHPTHQLTQVAFQLRAQELGYECQIVGAEAFDVIATIGLADQALARGNIAGVAVWTGSPAFNAFIERTSRLGVPIILPHFPMERAEVPGATAIVCGDPAEAGTAAAIEIAGQIAGTGTVAITQGSFNSTENRFAEAFTTTMKERHPKVKVLAPVEEGFDTVKAIAAASAILQANPDVVAALSTTGGGPLTWAGAQRNAGRKITIVSVNCTRANVDLVKSGEVHALVAQPLYEESAMSVDLIDRVRKGGTLPWWTKLPSPIVTKAGLAPYEAQLARVDAALKR